MQFGVKVVRRAAEQIEKAASWWAQNRPSAPDAIREELQVAFHLIARHPNAGALALNTKLRGVRRFHLSRIDYWLYFRVRPGTETAEVLAFWHTSRGAGPDLWRHSGLALDIGLWPSARTRHSSAPSSKRADCSGALSLHQVAQRASPGWKLDASPCPADTCIDRLESSPATCPRCAEKPRCWVAGEARIRAPVSPGLRLTAARDAAVPRGP